MKYLIITGSPKQDGLCRSITNEIAKGAADGGAQVAIQNTAGIESCRCCNDGWGSCGTEHECAFGEGSFNKAQENIRNADMICIITPVYWGESAEGLKSLMDRVRRCESVVKKDGALRVTNMNEGKQILLVAVPGGSGGGALSCLGQMERFCHHTGAVIFDFINVNRWNSDYKKIAAYSAAKAMAEGRKAGITVN